jgi:hypothetical protein
MANEQKKKKKKNATFIQLIENYICFYEIKSYNYTRQDIKESGMQLQLKQIILIS